MTFDSLIETYDVARFLAKQKAAPYSDTSCRYCGGTWRPFARTQLDGHAKCIVSDEFKQWLITWARQNPRVTEFDIARLLRVSIGTVRAWISPVAITAMDSRRIHCTTCGRHGHNARSCGQTDDERQAKRNRNGRQSRKSISINRGAYERLRIWCTRNEHSMSGVVEQLFADMTHCEVPTPRQRETLQAYDHPLRPPRVMREERTVCDIRNDSIRTASQGPVSDPIAQIARQRSVAVVWSEAVAELVRDSLGDLRTGRGAQPDRARDLDAALDAALVRMLDSYDALAASASHCAICRSRARPFTPKLAGESVVAVCSVCMREARSLDGRRAS